MDKRIPELDGLRALAILLVIAWHYVGIPAGPHSVLWRVFYLGHFGVDLFFVLSGFLIGSILIQTRELPGYFRDFYLRRALRIWPLYLLMVAAFTAGLETGRSPNLFAGAVPAWSYLLLIQNFWMASLQTYGAYWLAGTWSLAIEEQFYAVYPVVVRYVPLARLPVLLGGVIVMCPLLRLADAFTPDQFGYYVLPYYRADVLAIGALIAWLRFHKMTHRIPAMPVLVVCAALMLLVPVTGSDTFHSAAWQHTLAEFFFGALLLVVLSKRGSPYLAFLRSNIAAFFARTSYCAYLIHPIVGYAISRFQLGAFGAMLSFFATFVIAAASYRWIENPLLQLKSHRATACPRIDEVSAARRHRR